MPELRTMYMSDLPRVLAIIEQHDEDDGESADADFTENGLDNYYVIDIDDDVAGVTGFTEVEATDKTYWLGWTYLEESQRGQGLGKRMVSDLLEKLRAINGRKIFVKVSDYEDPEAGKIYEPALHMYQALGFTLEVTNNDFYDEGENQLILGLDLSATSTGDNDADFDAAEIADEKPLIRFNGLYEIAETDGAYTFSWTVKDGVKLFGKRSFSVEDLQLGLQSVKDEGGRKVFLTFPSNLPLIHKPLAAARFKYAGQLQDYYEQGVHELHFTHDLGEALTEIGVST